MLQHPTGNRQSHVAQVLEEKAALDFAPGSIWTRSTSLTSSAQTALLHTARLRTSLSSSRDAVDLRAFRLNDVIQPPGACTNAQNKTKTLASSSAIAIFSPVSRQSYVTATSLSGIQSASFYCVANEQVNMAVISFGHVNTGFQAFLSAEDASKKPRRSGFWQESFRNRQGELERPWISVI